MEKWSAMYWFAQGIIQQSHAGESGNVKQLENLRLSGSEIHLVAILYMCPSFPRTFPHVSPIVSPVSLDISHVSPVFSLFPILDLTQIIYVNSIWRYFICRHMWERCGNSSIWPLIISKGQLTSLIGKKHEDNDQGSTVQNLWILSQIIILMKPSQVMTKTLPGWIVL